MLDDCIGTNRIEPNGGCAWLAGWLAGRLAGLPGLPGGLSSGVPFGTPLDEYSPCLKPLGTSRSFSELHGSKNVTSSGRCCLGSRTDQQFLEAFKLGADSARPSEARPLPREAPCRAKRGAARSAAAAEGGRRRRRPRASRGPQTKARGDQTRNDPIAAGQARGG